MPFVHKLSKIYLRPAFLQAATKKSRSIVSSPILAWSPFISLSLSSSLFPEESAPKASLLFSKNSTFHLLIVATLTLNRVDSSRKLSLSLIASIATL